MLFSPRCLRILSLLVLVGLLGAGSAVHAQHMRMVRDTIGLQPDGKIKVSVTAGSVRVATWDRPAVAVRLRIEGKQASQGEGARLAVESGPNQVTIGAGNTGAESGGFLALMGLAESSGPDLHYTIRMPATADLSVTSESAPVEVRDLTGTVTVEGSSAPVRLRNVAGGATIATFSGSLDADSLRGDLIFATFSGDATVRRQVLDGNNQLATFSGSVDLTLPADAAFDFRTDITWGGSISSDFAAPDSSAQDEGPIPIGGGGPTVAFESFSGSLTLRAE